MPETVITVTFVLYQKYTKQRWRWISLTYFELAQIEWGAGKDSESVPGGNLFSNSTTKEAEIVRFWQRLSSAFFFPLAYYEARQN